MIAAMIAAMTVAMIALAAEFARKGFKLDGVVLNSKDKKNKVLPFVLKILRDNPDLDEESVDDHVRDGAFEVWVDVAWTSIIANVWSQLHGMLNKKRTAFKSSVIVGGAFAQCACWLGAIFHTLLCEKKGDCDFCCNKSLPERRVDLHLVSVICCASSLAYYVPKH